MNLNNQDNQNLFKTLRAPEDVAKGILREAARFKKEKECAAFRAAEHTGMLTRPSFKRRG